MKLYIYFFFFNLNFTIKSSISENLSHVEYNFFIYKNIFKETKKILKNLKKINYKTKKEINFNEFFLQIEISINNIQTNLNSFCLCMQNNNFVISKIIEIKSLLEKILFKEIKLKKFKKKRHNIIVEKKNNLNLIEYVIKTNFSLKEIIYYHNLSL